MWQKMEAWYVFGPSTRIKLDGNEWTQIRQDEEDEFRGQGTRLALCEWTFSMSLRACVWARDTCFACSQACVTKVADVE